MSPSIKQRQTLGHLGVHVSRVALLLPNHEAPAPPIAVLEQRSKGAQCVCILHTGAVAAIVQQIGSSEKPDPCGGRALKMLILFPCTVRDHVIAGEGCSRKAQSPGRTDDDDHDDVVLHLALHSRSSSRRARRSAETIDMAGRRGHSQRDGRLFLSWHGLHPLRQRVSDGSSAAVGLGIASQLGTPAVTCSWPHCLPGSGPTIPGFLRPPQNNLGIYGLVYFPPILADPPSPILYLAISVCF